MKTQLLICTLCLLVATGTDAATRRGRRPGTSTVPPKAKMIVLPALPAIPQVRDKADDGNELITTDIGGLDLQFFTTSIETGTMIATLGELAKTRAEAGVIKDIGSALAHTQSDENRPVTIDAFANDVFGADGVDTDNSPAVRVTFTQPAQGSVAYDPASGLFSFTPAMGPRPARPGRRPA